MEKKRLLITNPLPGPHFSELFGTSDFFIKLLNKKERENLVESVRQFDPHGIISLLSDTINSEIIENAPSLKIISNYAVGYNNIDVACAREKGIVVTNTPGVLTDATADIAMLLILMTSRCAVPAETFTRTGNFTGWLPSLFLGTDIKNKQLGLVGFGRIGQAVAKRAKAFGMNVVYFKRTKLSREEELNHGVTFMDFNELIETSHFVSLHLPYTSENHHMFSIDQFERMKKGSVFINTARGALHDEKALAAVLSGKRIFAAGLDVYEHEPSIFPDLLKLDNVVLLPHIGSATIETRSEMARMVINDVISVMQGKEPVYAV